MQKTDGVRRNRHGRWNARHTWWLFKLCLTGITVFLAHGSLLFAQVTYSLFPAKSSNSELDAPQPTRDDIGPHVTLSVHDSTIDYVVNAIASQGHVRPVYDNGNPLFAQRISLAIKDAAVTNAFALALKGTGLVAKVTSDGETVVIRPSSSSAKHPQIVNGRIVGRVTDSASGVGLGGATVKIAGTKLGAVTSDSGHFTIEDVPSGNQIITARLFGYKQSTREITVSDSGQTVVRIGLVRVVTALSGVVTTASGVQRRLEVGNDITTLNVDSVMRVAPITSVTDLLATRVPGLTILRSSGVPGDPSRLRLRGAGSITGNNDPIIVIDGIRVYAAQSDTRNNNLAPSVLGGTDRGVTRGLQQQGSYAAPSPLDQIDPSTIETIEVFKGPSASALYGSDAANGVIVITTKHGRTGPTHWTLNVGQGVNWLPGKWPDNTFIFGYNGRTYPVCNWYDAGCVVDSLVTFQALNDPRYTVFSHGHDQTTALSVSGGVSTLTYSLTGSAAGNVGALKLPAIEIQRYNKFYGAIPGWMVRPDNYSTWGVDGTMAAQPMPSVRVGIQSSYFSSTQQRSSLEQAISQLNGEYIDATQLASTPLIQNEVERATAGSLTSRVAMTLGWQPYQRLPVTVTGGINTIQRNDETYVPFGVNTAGPGSTIADTTGSYGVGRGTSHDITLSAGTVTPFFNQRLTLAVGANDYTNTTNDFSGSSNQLAPGVTIPNQLGNVDCNFNINDKPTCINVNSSSQSTAGSSTYGWYIEPRLNFQSRFFVAPGFRFDGGSAGSHASYSGAGTGGFGGLTALPKIDFSWVAVDRQSEHPMFGLLSLLRPRVAFGFAGTQPDPTQKLRLFRDTLSMVNVGSIAPIVQLSNLGNTALRPERSSEMEGGFEATLWQNRLTVSFTHYSKTRKDAIISIPIAASVSGNGLGGSSIAKNIGVVRNTGTEVTASAFVWQSRTVSWNVGMNMSRNNSLVVRLNPGQAPIDYGDGTRVVAGYPLFSMWARPITSYADVNHNGVIDNNEVQLADSAVYVGQPDANYTMNMTSDLTFLSGRVSVHATFAYQNGLTQNNVGALNSGAFKNAANSPETPFSMEAAIQAATGICGRDFFGGIVCDPGSNIGVIQTVNTLRFNDLSINFELPKSVSNRFRVPRMMMAIQGSNLGLHTNYRGKDPNVNAFSTVSGADETLDLGQIPEPRTWWLKLSIGN